MVRKASSQSSCPGSRMLTPCSLEVGAGTKTRCGEPGSRPGAGKVQIGKQVDRGDPRMRPLLGLKPLTKQYVTCSSCSRGSRRPGPSAAIVYCSGMVDTSIVSLFSQKYPTTRGDKDKACSGPVSCKPSHSETMQAKAAVSIDRERSDSLSLGRGRGTGMETR